MTHISPHLVKDSHQIQPDRQKPSSLVEIKREKKSKKQVLIISLLWKLVTSGFFKAFTLQWGNTDLVIWLLTDSGRSQKHSFEPLVLLHLEDVYTSLCVCVSSGLSRVMHFFHYPHQINVKHSSIYCPCATTVCVFVCMCVTKTTLNKQIFDQWKLGQSVYQMWFPYNQLLCRYFTAARL